MPGAIVWAISIAWLYGPALIGLARQWQNDPTYSHGWVILPIAAGVVWHRRDRLRRLTPRPSASGLVVLAASLALFVVGTLGAELFLTRVSLIGVLAGTVLFAFGRAHLRAVAFPLAF